MDFSLFSFDLIEWLFTQFWFCCTDQFTGNLDYRKKRIPILLKVIIEPYLALHAAHVFLYVCFSFVVVFFGVCDSLMLCEIIHYILSFNSSIR